MLRSARYIFTHDVSVRFMVQRGCNSGWEEREREGGREGGRGTYEDVDETGDMSMLEGFQDIDLGL